MRLALTMKRHALLCIILHLILALIYIVALVLAKARVFDNALHLSEDTARTVVTVVTQSFTIVRTFIAMNQPTSLIEVTARCIAQFSSSLHNVLPYMRSSMADKPSPLCMTSPRLG